MNPGGNPSVNMNMQMNQGHNKNQAAAPTTLKLSPINQSKQRSIELPQIVNSEFKKRFDSLANKDAVVKVHLPQDKKFRIKRNKIVDTGAKSSKHAEETKTFNYTQFPQFSSQALADSKDNDEVVIENKSIEQIEKHKADRDDGQRNSNEKLTTIVESPQIDRDDKNTEESKSVHLI